MNGFGERYYRLLHGQKDLTFFRIIVKETDLDIGIDRQKYTPDLDSKVREQVLSLRRELEDYIKWDPQFVKTMTPYSPLPTAPEIAREMARAAGKAGVGPMAAVAGAFSAYIGRYLALRAANVIVENGGDIYLRSSKQRLIGVFAARSPFTNRIALKIKHHQSPLGICTSSGTVGHSASMGKADAVVVLAPSVPLADAVATAAGNRVAGEKDLQQAVEFAVGVPGVAGALAIMGDKLAAAGDIEIVPI